MIIANIKIYLVSLFFLFSICATKAQEKIKDTLFFNIDKHYTISPTITPNMSKQTYPELVKTHRKQMQETKTNGYIYFVGNRFLTTNLKPKKVLLIKDFIENRKFYFDGKYNKIIDKWKWKDSLTDKYTVFFVNGTEYIQPRYLEYISYYPLRDKDWNVIENKVKDTLFFKWDNKYMSQSKYDPNLVLIEDAHDTSIGGFYFQKNQILK